MMRKIFLVWMMSGLVSVLCYQMQAQAGDFVLSESYPENGQTVKVPDLFNNRIYLKFNNPVDRDTITRIVIESVSDYCQLNICGWIEYAENDTELIWHPNDNYEIFFFKPGASFKIRIGVSDLGMQYRLKDIYGEKLPITYIEFKIDECTPAIKINVSGNSLHDYFPAFILGDTITVQIHLVNPVCGGEIEIEGKIWLELPDGTSIPLISPAAFKLYGGDDISFNFIRYTFSGTEPCGYYKIGARLINAINGDYYSRTHASFSFGTKCLWLGRYGFSNN